MSDLLPCPFCDVINGYGATPLELSQSPSKAWYVNCDNCCADGPACDTEAEAIAAWNRRTPASAVPGKATDGQQ